MVRHSLEMSLSREEFFRLLPAAVGPVDATGDTIEGRVGPCRWRISLARLADHRAGSVVVPRHRVDIEIEECGDADAGAFMDRFHRAFLRGGG
jgi:hypothetical protein